MRPCVPISIVRLFTCDTEYELTMVAIRRTAPTMMVASLASSVIRELLNMLTV